MKKLTLLLIGVLCTALSCSTQDEFKVTSDEQLLNTSYAFRSLNVPVSELDFTNAHKTATEAGFNVLIVPFKSTQRKSIINLLNDDGNIVLSALSEIESSIKPENYATAFEQKQFEGTFSVLGSNGDYFGFDFKQSKIVNMFIGAGNGGSDPSAKTEECKGWTELGGPLDCAGASLQNEGPVSKAECYWSFGFCFLFKVVDCWWSGCPMTPVTFNKTIKINGILYTSEANPNIINPPIVRAPINKYNIDPSIFEE